MFLYVLQEKLLVKISHHASMKKNLADSQQKFGSRTTLALYMLNDWLEQENKLLKPYWEQQLGTPEVRVMQKQKTCAENSESRPNRNSNEFSVIRSCTPFGSPLLYYIFSCKFKVFFFILKKKKKNTLYGFLADCCQSKPFYQLI